MANLRIIRYSVVDATTIKVVFNANLDSTINISNIEIESFSANLPDSRPISVDIDDETLTITTLPLTPFGIYKLKLFSTNTSLFRGINGSVLLEDGKTNEPFINGPPNPSNDIRDAIQRYHRKTPYEAATFNNSTIIGSIVNSQADELYKARNTINQLKTDNYVSITKTDEFHTRKKGPFDRLDNEGVYEIISVSQYPSTFVAEKEVVISDFPIEPVSLQAISVSNERLFGSNSDEKETFSGITLNLSHNYVSKVISITIIYALTATAISYNLDGYGYQLKDARYDKNASTYTLLENYQVKLSQKALGSGIIPPVIGDTVIVSYEYKNTGILVDKTSIAINEIKLQTREVCPPIATVFSLNHSNIVRATGVAATVGDITFLDPQAVPPFSAKHPAFVNEIAFSTERMPSAPGFYSVDYSTGKVYVFGSDETRENVGTGTFPPVCSYYYKFPYVEDLDYSYEETLMEVAANPERDLFEKAVILTFNYQENYVDNVDYVAQIHKEELSERIENRLIGTNTITPLYSPITNVFRIYNETTGEIYRLNRFTDNKIYFNYNFPPSVIGMKDEKAAFEKIYDEILLETQELTNVSAAVIWEINLNNNNITNAYEDSLASSIDTSLSFSNKKVFVREAYYDRDLSLTINLNKLTTVGDYVVDYANGIVYVSVLANQTPDIGSASYNSKYIVTNVDHIMSVNLIYSTIDGSVDIKNIVSYDYNTFTDTKIDLYEYPYSDRRYLSTGPDIPMTVLTSLVELPVSAKGLRGLYESTNLNTSYSPINFAIGSSVDETLATLVPVELITSSVVSAGLTVSVPEVAANSNFQITSIVYVKSATGVEFFDTAAADGTFLGSTISLPSDTLASPGDVVSVSVMIKLADNSGVIADIDYGGIYVNYNALIDEIIISYEHGDNQLDFRESETILEGKEYYVSYKYGALRDSLLANFGSVIEIDQIKNFNVDLNRERYRDAIQACLQTFPKGPTVGAIKEIAKKISHVEPKLIESLFEEWVLGSSHLYDNEITVSGCSLMSAVWDYGIYFANELDYLKIPVSSNIKLDGGTLEFWATPNWDGIDNDASLTMQIFKDGYLLSPNKIWLGATGYHPTFDDNNKFLISRFDSPSVLGQPHNITTDGYGAFVYYDNTNKMWNLIAKDSVRGSTYTGTITTSGEFYNVRSILLETSDIRITQNSNMSFVFKLDGYDGYKDAYDGYVDGLRFMSDETHYFLDYAESENENRISLFKDGKGYLTLKVRSSKDKYDRAHIYQVSHDISDWESGFPHHIAISNILNSKNHRDELHLFVDGFEVPNIIKYGGRPAVSSHYRFMTVVPELVVGTVTLNTLAANDMVTTAGSDIVTSNSVDFGLEGMAPGDLLYIEEQGFLSYYVVLAIVDFHTLQLNSVMPISLTNVTYSINKWTAPVSTELMYEANLLVTRYDGTTEYELPGLRATIPAYAISVDGYGQPSIVIRSDAKAGDKIYIRTLGLNHRRVQDKMYVWSDGYENMIRTSMPSPINLDYVDIHPITKLKYVMNSAMPSYGNTDGTVFVVGDSVSVIGITPDTQPSNNVGGRTLSVSVSGDNIDYSTPVVIRINGTTWSGAPFEDISFTSSKTILSSEQFRTVTSIDGYALTINPSRATASFEIKEAFEMTYPENDGYLPVLRYSYEEASSIAFSGIGNVVGNNVITFYHSQIGKSLVISSPVASAGTYIITDIIDAHTISVTPAIPVPFLTGTGKIYDVSISRSGFQNGLFYFEVAGNTPTPFYLNRGYYAFDYSTYLEIPFEFKEKYLYVGSDYLGSKQAKAIIDEFRSLVITSVDTRIGETVPSNGNSITVDYLRNKPFVANQDTLMLLHMDELPPINSAVPYTRYSREYFQSDYSVNDEFDHSLYVSDKPLILDNNGIISNSAGTIEFWFSPDYDSRNDMLDRYLFDANSAIVEEITSLTKTTISLSTRAKVVYSIQLASDNTTTGVNYAIGGSLSANGLSYTLGRTLPYQQMPVKVIYAPYSVVGNRISIYKDSKSICRFRIFANNRSYELSTPVFWARDTWHRIMATWDLSKPRQGEMHLFIDGEEKIIITAGSFIAGTGFVAGNLMPNTNATLNISLKDQFQQLFIGSNFLGGEVMKAKIDNLKISRYKKLPIYISGQPYDNDYNSNIDSAMPVVTDLYTTYLLDATKYVNKIEDFTILKNKVNGIFDFTIKVFDLFDVINDNTRVKEILEALINTLKPAQSRAFIQYVE